MQEERRGIERREQRGWRGIRALLIRSSVRRYYNQRIRKDLIKKRKTKKRREEIKEKKKRNGEKGEEARRHTYK